MANALTPQHQFALHDFHPPEANRHAYSVRPSPLPRVRCLGQGLASSTSRSFQDCDQEDENNNQYNNGGHLLVLAGAPRHLAEGIPRTIQTTLVTVCNGLDLVQHGNMAIQLVAYLHAELTLAADGLAQVVELRVLVAEDL